MDANLTIRMTPEFYQQLVDASKADRRRIGEFARILLEDAFTEWKRLHDAPPVAATQVDDA